MTFKITKKAGHIPLPVLDIEYGEGKHTELDLKAVFYIALWSTIVVMAYNYGQFSGIYYQQFMQKCSGVLNQYPNAGLPLHPYINENYSGNPMTKLYYPEYNGEVIPAEPKP